MKQVLIPAIEGMINGVPINVGDSWVQLKDNATGFTGPGSYHIQLRVSSSFAAPYVVSYGLRPCDTRSLMTVARIVLTPNGTVLKKDTRPLNVTIEAVNSTIAATVFTDGSYLDTGVVTVRTIAGGVIGGAGGLLDQIGAVEGDILYRGASEWLVLSPGTAGQLLETGGASAAPSWTTAGTGTLTSITFNNGLTASPNPIVSSGTAGLAAIADSDVLANTSGSSAVPVATSVSTLLDHAIGNTRGSILERGASGWQIIMPGTSGYIFTSGGSGSDPSWQPPAAMGVTSLNSLTGAVTIDSPDGSVAVGLVGSNITLEVSSPGVLPVVNGDVPPVLVYTDDGSLVYEAV